MSRLVPILFVFAILLMSKPHLVSAQESRVDESEVPIKVQAKFYGKYSEASDVKWKTEGQSGQFIAMFYTKNRKISAKYDENGKILEIENISDKAVLPEEVNIHLEDRFPGAKIVELKKVTLYYVEGTTGPQDYYELLLKDGKKKTSVFFDGEMNLMSADNIFNLAVN